MDKKHWRDSRTFYTEWQRQHSVKCLWDEVNLSGNGIMYRRRTIFFVPDECPFEAEHVVSVGELDRVFVVDTSSG